MVIRKNNIPLVFLMLYFLTKMLWDKSVPYIFEIISILILFNGFVNFFTKSLNKQKIIYLFLYGTFSIYILINGICQNSFAQIQRSLYEYILYTSFIFSMAYYIKKADFIKTCKIISELGIIISILSWYEWISKSYLVGSFANIITYGNYIGFRSAVFSRSFLSHGVVLGFFGIISFYLYLTMKNKNYLLISGFNILSILTTSSRGPLVSTVVAIFFMYIFKNNLLKKHDKRKIMANIIIIVAICLIIFILLSNIKTGNSSIDYFLYRIRQIINWTGDAGNVGRLKFWSEALNYFKESPIFGIGPSKTGSWGIESIGVTESGILKHLCELGIVGFSLYYILFFSILFKGYKQYKIASNRDKLKLILFFGVVAMVFLNNITLQSTEEIMIFIIYSFGLGGILSMNYKDSEV
ncbi:hypothetical protein BO225_09840 [Dubosiella newyorkensis]|uniref:O-antigen ligase-related domain-containing protein n=2 Tax=Dubosiella newyorkensis TaxID=1862672 RepID=A0A1U7NKK2_9FIRM|nr:hypothetical protein BO225_09840 [Dubosiella newyorkensis]